MEMHADDLEHMCTTGSPTACAIGTGAPVYREAALQVFPQNFSPEIHYDNPY